MSALAAVLSLVLSLALLLVPGGVLFLLLSLGGFLLALGGVLTGLQDHTVHQHEPAMSPRSWRGDD
jgi:hypothetical protein